MANVDHGTTDSPAAAAEPGTIQLAQASGEPIGQISSAAQPVHVTHADGSSEDLGVGGQIYANDVVRTAPDGAVGITFVDGTQFSLGGGAEMQIDKLIYDPSGSDNSLALNVVQGAFVFVTGGIAGAPGEGMTVGTPAGSIGVRGTSVGGHYGEGPEGWVIALLKDADGHVGKVVVYNGKGEVVLDQVFQSTTLIDFNTPPATPHILTKIEIEGLFGKPLENLPDIQLQNELLDQHGELDINTAAGGGSSGGPNHGSHFFTPTGFADFAFGLLGLVLPPSTLGETQLDYNTFGNNEHNPNDKQFGGTPPLLGLALGGGHLSENSPDGTVAGFVAAVVGGPPNASYTYSLLDQHGNQALQIFSARSFASFAEPEPAFTIDPNTGVITVNNSALLDFETTPGFSLTIHAQNNSGQSVNVPFEIDLEDVNDNPPIIDPLGSVDLPENSLAGTVVATVTATDADTTGGPTQFSIVPSSNPDGWFAINSLTGEITLTAAGAASPLLDFESGIHTATLQIIATDGTNEATPIDVEIDITNLLEPVWSISGASEVTEGGSATYFVSYGGEVLAPGQILTVEVAPGSGTAISGTDFVGGSATLTFTGGGETSQSIGVSTIDDTIIEGTENFSVTISNPNAGTIATPTDSTLLIDNQEPLVWDVSGNSAGTEGTVATYTVSYSGATLADGISVTVTVSSHSGSATQDQDFGGIDQVLTFTGDEATSQTITVSLLADSTVEDPENFTVSLSSDTGDTGEATTTTVIDDPSQPIAWSLAGTDTVEEGQNAVYTVSYLGGPIALGATATVTIASSSGSAQDGEDFSGGTTVLTFVGGDPSSQTVTIAAVADTIIEGTEDFSVAITGVSGGSVDSGTVTTDITDQSSGPTWSINGDSAVAEGDAATYTVSYSDASLAAGQTVLVTVDTASGSASEDSDFDGEHIVLTFTGGGESAQTVTVQALSDTQVEGTEDFSVAITPSLGDSGIGSLTTRIIDQTTGPTWSISGDSSVAEGSDASYTVGYTDAGLASGQTAFVTVDSASGTATEGGEGGDFDGEHIVLTFIGGGESSQTLSIHTSSDTVIEGTEDFSVAIAPSLGGIGAGSVTTEIIDQTTGPTWSVTGDSSVAEGQDATYTVSYSDASLAAGQTAFVTVDTAPGSAADGSDYDGGQTVLTFVGGESAQTLAIHTEADTLVEGTEDFSVAITPSLGDIGAGSVTTEIVDRTTGPAWSIAGASTVSEGNNALYTVSYSGAALAPGQTALITVQTHSGTATEGTDFDSRDGAILTFVGGGGTSQTLTVHADTDTVVEGTENYAVQISNPTLGAIGVGTAATNVVDETTGPLWTLSGDSSITEGDDATYTVSYSDASLAPGQNILVTVDSASGSAGEGNDFTGDHSVLTFTGGGESAQTLVIHTIEDTVAEGNEDYSVTISPSHGEVGTDAVTTTIIDDDEPDRLLVGTDSGNTGPGAANVSSTSPYANLILQGGKGQDILIGDSGGATHLPGGLQYEDQNGVAVLDRSGSVANGNILQLSKSIVLSLAQKYATYAHDAFVAGQDVTVKFTIIPFNDSAGPAITVTAHGLGDLVETSPGSGVWQFASLAGSVNIITASGSTDYQDALLAARNQLLADNGLPSNANYAPLTGFDGNNRLFFISDGHPSEQTSTFQHYDSPASSSGLDYWRGVWTALGVEALGIGLGLTAQSSDFTNLQTIDNTGGAEIVTAADQVGFALAGTFQPGADIPNAVGGDSLSGGNGQDIIFGDVVNTDHLDASTVTGGGYDALFAQIQSSLGHAPSDQEVLTYIRTHLDALYEDNDPRGAADHIDAGAGDDTVFAQGGDDTVIGGTGADLLDGGTGNDRIVADAVAGQPDGAVDTLIGGMGSDILVGADGEADYFQWKAGHRGAEGTAGLHAQSGTTFNEGSGEITVTTTLGDPHNIHYFTFEVTGTESQSLTIDLKSLGGTLDSQIYLFKDSNGNGLVGSKANDPLVSANNDGSGPYGIASDGSTNGQDSFMVQGQLAPGKYILAIGDSTLTEAEARSNDSANGNSNNASGSGQYQLTITGQNVDLTGGHGLTQDDTDTVQGFQIGGAPGSRDVLDFSDLLSGAPHTGAGATAANLSSYFDVSFSGGNTVLSVDYNGAAGPPGSGFDSQLHVVLQGVSQASWGGSQDEAQVLTTLLANGQLTT